MNEPHVRVRAALEDAGVAYTVHDHSKLTGPILNAEDFSRAIGYGLDRITKTLVLVTHSGDQVVAGVCAMNRKLDLKALATQLGAKRLEVASAALLQDIAGYPRNGVSPIGLPASVKIVIDSQLMDHKSILVGGGATGVEIELDPKELAALTGALVTDIVSA